MPSPQCIGRDIRSDIVWLGPADWCGKEAPGLFQNSTPAWFASSWTYEPQSGHLFYNEAKKGLMCLSSKDGKGHPLRVVKCAAKDASQKFAVFTFNYKQSTSFAIGRRILFTFNCIKTSPSSKTSDFASLYWDKCLQPKSKYTKFDPKQLGKINQTLFSLV
ncbi:hypothetical protein TYRP_016962 [Tyrophagus putrescentiae]|nr:hypothetical protein TYRP_016962 [Tyrophagus putrescentiae]